MICRPGKENRGGAADGGRTLRNLELTHLLRQGLRHVIHLEEQGDGRNNEEVRR